MADTKMIVTDLDGTLLRDDKTISPYTIEVIKKVQQAGHKFVIATARPMRVAKKFLNLLETNAEIYHNGALIYSEGQKIDAFEINDIKTVVDSILNTYPSSSLAIESDDVLYANFNVKRLWPECDYIYSDFSELSDKKANKIIIEVSSFKDMKKYECLLPSNLYIQLSENKIGMIMNSNASKSNGIRLLSQKYNIPRENIIAFGDDYNDIDMLTFCGQGICVENAAAEIKVHATSVCDTNENDGVAKWIEKNFLSFSA